MLLSNFRAVANVMGLFSRKLQQSIQSYTTQASRSSSRPRLVVLGSGWGAASLAKNIDTNQFAVTVLSSLNHMVKFFFSITFLPGMSTLVSNTSAPVT
jgi:hypothetical protein